MDWQGAIEKHGGMLKRILVMLATMAGMPASAGAKNGTAAGVRPDTLPRHLHRLVLRLLRPAEAATRRLIVVAARGLAVEAPTPCVARRSHKTKPSRTRRNGYGTGMVIRPGPLPEWALSLVPKRSPALSLPLLDPLKRFNVRRVYVGSQAAPHIRSLGGDPIVPLFRRPEPPITPPPSPNDPIDAGRLQRRIEAIGRALDDLPRQAKRLAFWQARRDARLALGKGEAESAASGRKQRFSPMRPGRPPGWRRRQDHAVYGVLTELHGLAVWAMEQPDTS